MPKRSLHSGDGGKKKAEQLKIEQLNKAVELMLSPTDGKLGRGKISKEKLGRVEAGIEPLVRVATELRDLPREAFRTRLKTELFEGRNIMASVAEPIKAVRTTATPRLTFKDAAKAIEFYKQAFGAKEMMRFDTGESIPHAEIMIGDSAIMLSEEWPEGGRLSAETLGYSPVQLSIDVADVDSFAKRAVAAGMKALGPIRDQFYGRREGSFVDPFGYTWNISTVTEEMSVEEMHRRMAKMTRGPEGGQLPQHDAQEGKARVNPIPRGFRTVTPYLIAKDGPALLEFAKKAFGGEETFRTVGAAGGLHGEMRIGDSMLMMGGGIPGKEFHATPNTHALHLYVEDADAVCAKALAAGATLIDEPRDQEYGERSASVKDPAGNIWYIATSIAKNRGESYIAKGLNNVNVYMHPLRAEPVISFLKRAFGATELAKYASPDGVVHHAEIRVGDSVVEMGEPSGEAQGKYPPMPTMFYMYVPDCDAVYRSALTAGATSISEPADQPYGDRSAGVKDAFGNTWYIATHFKDVQM
ncbi:MAG: VOC family protein [Candidatus Sulfotelmatobacter sp.]